jgi:nucleotide-binding universal stress UspA family protein
MLLNVITPEGQAGGKIPASSGLVPNAPTDAGGIWEIYHQPLQAYEEQGLERLCRFSEEVAALNLQAEFTQDFGSPERAICNLARAWKADLIMINDLIMVGSHQRTGLSEWRMGSISNYVLNHASCSVLVINRPTSPQTAVEAAALATVAG